MLLNEWLIVIQIYKNRAKKTNIGKGVRICVSYIYGYKKMGVLYSRPIIKNGGVN